MKPIKNLPVELWERVVSRSDYATFFHSPTWARIVVEAFPQYRLATRAFCLDDGMVAIVPMVASLERNGLFRWHESMYPGGYGGAVAERALEPAETDLVYRRLMDARMAYVHVTGNPFADQSLPAEYRRTPDHTHVIDLAPGYEALLEQYTDEKKRGIRKAVRQGVEISLAATLDDYHAYYAVYEDTLRRWGEHTLVRYPAGLFERLYAYRSDHVRLWLARVAGQVVSGSIFFCQNRHVVYWHGATLEVFFRHHPATLLMTEAIRDACQRGYRYFDFGPSSGLAGVEKFKEGFGARRWPFEH